MINKFKNRSRAVRAYIEDQQNTYYVKEDNPSAVPFDYIIEQLDEESRRIIYHDYIVVHPKGWYDDFYSRSTYYRLKNIALDKFLALIKTT